MENMHKPEWLRVHLPAAMKASRVVKLLASRGLNTICTSGLCPNRGECWERGTATFMLCGDVCTRNCRFCNVKTGKPAPTDPKEADDICEAVRLLSLHHVVLTSVDRDDLPDLGAGHWCDVIGQLKERFPGVTIEALIPDFQNRTELIDRVTRAQPDIISHNLETVRRLTPSVRSVATYDGSLSVLRHIAERGVRAKSGIMLGLGETEAEVIETMDDLIAVGCSVLTIGQYLQPTRRHYEVREYVRPEVFERLGEIGRSKGFRHVESAPLVRSSYKAEEHLL